jgi:hypothetical protein
MVTPRLIANAAHKKTPRLLTLLRKAQGDQQAGRRCRSGHR